VYGRLTELGYFAFDASFYLSDAGEDDGGEEDEGFLKIRIFKQNTSTMSDITRRFLERRGYKFTKQKGNGPEDGDKEQ
jgi:hypothetical protein